MTYFASRLKCLSSYLWDTTLAVAAIQIEREGVHYPSVVHLKGAVEIRMPVCVVTGPGTVQHCAGEIVFHADEADLHEDTGQIEAKGAARITRIASR